MRRGLQRIYDDRQTEQAEGDIDRSVVNVRPDEGEAVVLVLRMRLRLRGELFDRNNTENTDESSLQAAEKLSRPRQAQLERARNARRLRIHGKG